jgi:hypothetical protein
MINTNESLYIFRDMANQMFRLAMAARDGNPQKAMQYYDEGLTTMLKVLEAKEAEQKVSTVLSSEIGNTITNAYLTRDVFEPIPVPSVAKGPSPPTLVIHHDLSPNVIVTKEDSREKIIRLDSGNEVRTGLIYPFCQGTSLSMLGINVSCGEGDEGEAIDAEEEIEPDIEEEDSEEKCCPLAPACECPILLKPDDDGYHRCCPLDPACDHPRPPPRD